MKRFLVALIVVFSISLYAEKIALVPAVPDIAYLADQVLAEMPDDSNVEFLERMAVEKVLKERKLHGSGINRHNISTLGNILHVDLFAVISARMENKKIVPSGLTVYSARSGFRLIDKSLPEKNTVAVIAELLKRAVDIQLHPNKQIWLSVVSVRSAGVPERYKYKSEYVAAEMERTFGDIPGVIMLERNYLGSVNLEREVTGKIFKLAPSAKLIRLEFSPGSSPEIVNLTLRITNASGNVLFRWEKDNCLGAGVKIVAQEASDAVAKYLKVAPRELYSSEQEASRFFNEYRLLSRLGEFAAAKQHLESAIALVPNNLDYQLEMLRLYLLAAGKSNKKIISALQENLKRAKLIKQQFPGKASKLYRDANYFKRPFLYPSQVVYRKDMAAFCEDFRPEYIEEIKEYIKPKRGNKYSSPEIELHYNCVYTEYVRRYDLYYDYDKWRRDYLRLMVDNMKNSLSMFMQAKKDGREIKVPPHLKYCAWFLTPFLNEIELQSPFYNSRDWEARRVPLEKVIRESNEYIALALQHPLPEVKIQGMFLQALQKIVAEKYELKKSREIFSEYCRRAIAIDRASFVKLQDMGLNYYLFCGNPFLRDALKAVVVDAKSSSRVKRAGTGNSRTEKSDVQGAMEVIVSINRSGNTLAQSKAFIKKFAELKKYYHLLFTAMKPRKLFDIMTHAQSWQCVSTGEMTEKKRVAYAAIKTINWKSSIRKLDTIMRFCMPIRYDSKMKNYYRIINTRLVGNRIYMLVRCSTHGKHDSATIATYRINRDKSRMEKKWASVPDFGHKRNHDGLPYSFDAFGKIAVIAYEKNIYVLTRGLEKVVKISDLPGKRVMAVAIMNKRIYAFIGDDNVYAYSSRVASLTVLMSCDFDGRNRKIHMSTGRDNKQTDLDDKLPFWVNFMFADKDRKRLVFVCDSRSRGKGEYNRELVKGLWAFDPETGKGKCLCKSFLYKGCNVIRNRVYMGQKFCDLATDKVEDVCSVALPGENPPKFIWSIPKGSFFRPGEVWFKTYGGESNINRIDLNNFENSSITVIPDQSQAFWLYPHPDNKSALVVSNHNIFKITPK